jgi:hypothetical protein
MTMNSELGDRLDRIDAQLAGLVGIARALVAVSTGPQRRQLLAAIQRELEGLHAVILADSGAHSEAALRGIEDLRASFPTTEGEQPGT